MLVCASYTEVHQNSMAEGTQTLQGDQPWLCSAEPHVEAPEAPGNFQTQQNHSKEKRGKGSEKGHPSPISTSSLVPGPYLAGGVCSQCFAEGQNSQSPDCRSCYSPGGQSEFLLPTEDVEKREGVLVTNWYNPKHMFPTWKKMHRHC